MSIFGFSKDEKYRFKVKNGDESPCTPKYELLEEEERFIQGFLYKCKINGVPPRKIEFRRIYTGLINIFYKGNFGRVGGFNFQTDPSFVSYNVNNDPFADGELIEGEYDDCVKGIDYIIEFIKKYVSKV